MAEKSNQQMRRERLHQRQKRQQNTTRFMLAAMALVVIGFVVYFVNIVTKPPAGEEVEIMASFNHVPIGTDVDYSTDPPTSGDHYAQTMPQGFYEQGQITSAFPESNIMHNMEHGYVVIWYNCAILDAVACGLLKDQIRAVLADIGDSKVIVFPWISISEQVVLTSWGQILRMDTFDPNLAAEFVAANRSNPRAPEPNAP